VLDLNTAVQAAAKLPEIPSRRQSDRQLVGAGAGEAGRA
jgi:hypothetical protein